MFLFFFYPRCLWPGPSHIFVVCFCLVLGLHVKFAADSFSAFIEYAEKYQELLERQDYFHDFDGENGNEG